MRESGGSRRWGYSGKTSRGVSRRPDGGQKGGLRHVLLMRASPSRGARRLPRRAWAREAGQNRVLQRERLDMTSHVSNLGLTYRTRRPASEVRSRRLRPPRHQQEQWRPRKRGRAEQGPRAQSARGRRRRRGR
ncbi:hypothetical protein C2E23DRAFT_266502 [Lenzites betulinus]|nr:hypothetical protein C2E23DRAFT_266502 [Lenzites betulinus]